MPASRAPEGGGGIQVELTATERVGLQRDTFPKAGDAHVALDLDP